MSLQDTYKTYASTSARESVSSNEFRKTCFVSNKAEEVKQEKDISEVNSCFNGHIPCSFDTSRGIFIFCQSCWQEFY